MDSVGLRKGRWVLTPQAFDMLLAQLDSSRELAGEKYERLHAKLVKFFGWRGCPSPEDHADETLNRVARKLEDGEQIQDVYGFAGGVARKLALEIIKQEHRARVALRELPTVQEVPGAPGPDRRHRCFERSLARLPPETQALILRYYEADRAKSETRRALAERLGVPVSVLRVRVHRVRARLERQVRECMRYSEREIAR